jgi:hypothetical protein
MLKMHTVNSKASFKKSQEGTTKIVEEQIK